MFNGIIDNSMATLKAPKSMHLHLMDRSFGKISSMTVLEQIRQALNEGDPEVRKWFLISSYFWPPTLCILYVIVVKKIGPALMKNRKPFDLRKIMVVYNFSLVALYTTCFATVIGAALNPDNYKYICNKTDFFINPETRKCAIVGYAIYIAKYIEFLDTIFFVLRKKENLITNLHVVHHATLPFIAWIIFRTEISGFQFFPGMTNAFVHMIMYTYYGLAALGPQFRKYLWWKKHLTILQMVQFVVIFFFVAIAGPLIGCQTSKFGLIIDTVFAVLFLAFFHNYYTHTYKQNKGAGTTNGHCSATANGYLNGTKPEPLINKED